MKINVIRVKRDSLFDLIASRLITQCDDVV